MIIENIYGSLQDMVEVYSPVAHMKKMTRRQMLYMIQLIGEWMIEEKREGYLIQLL